MDVDQMPCAHCGTINEIFSLRAGGYTPQCVYCQEPVRAPHKPTRVGAGPTLYLQHIPGKGLGVFTRKILSEGMLVERCPAFLIEDSDGDEAALIAALAKLRLVPYAKGRRVELAHMVKPWLTNDIKALSLGYGMLYNHAPMSKSNTTYKPYVDPDTNRHYFDYTAKKRIDAGSELTITYNHQELLWFHEKRGA
jgi:hypothetical protein